MCTDGIYFTNVLNVFISHILSDLSSLFPYRCCCLALMFSTEHVWSHLRGFLARSAAQCAERSSMRHGWSMMLLNSSDTNVPQGTCAKTETLGNRTAYNTLYLGKCIQDTFTVIAVHSRNYSLASSSLFIGTITLFFISKSIRFLNQEGGGMKSLMIWLPKITAKPDSHLNVITFDS